MILVIVVTIFPKIHTLLIRTGHTGRSRQCWRCWRGEQDVEQEFWIRTYALFALLHMWERDRRDKGMCQRTRSINMAVLQTCIPPGPWLQKLFWRLWCPHPEYKMNGTEGLGVEGLGFRMPDPSKQHRDMHLPLACHSSMLRFGFLVCSVAAKALSPRKHGIPLF